MSSGFIAAPEEIIQNPSLGPLAALLYGRIWRYCQGGGHCFASVETLADECGVSPRTISRWVSTLADEGYITVQSGKRSGKPNSISTTRKWVMGEVSQIDRPGSANVAEGVSQNGRPGKPERRTGVSQNGRRLKDFEEKTEESTPADAGGARGRAAAPAAARKAPADPAPHQALFGDLCHAAGLSSKDLVPGYREQLGQLAARLLEEPEADRPDRNTLRGIYQAEHAALSARLGRPADALTPQQFRQALGRWITSRRQETEDRQRRAEQALREAEDHARWLATREKAARPKAPRKPEASSQRAAELWQAIVGQLRPTMSPATWGQWLSTTVGMAIDDDGYLVVEVANSYAEDWITQRLGGALRPLVEAAGLTDFRLVAADAAEERAA